MPIKKSLYEIAEHQQDVVTNKGFDYQGHIFERSMSSFMFRDPTRASLLAQIESVVFELIERVKTIKNHVNYIVPKNYRNKN
jgi:hypothetical protein